MGFDNGTGAQCGLGADDKVGIAFALEMLKRLTAIKCFFPKDEEIGGLGSKAACLDFFEDCSMLVQLDRNSYNNDLIEHTNGIQVLSKKFKKATRSIMTQFNYEFAHGSFTDIGVLKGRKVDCVAMNVS